MSLYVPDPKADKIKANTNLIQEDDMNKCFSKAWNALMPLPFLLNNQSCPGYTGSGFCVSGTVSGPILLCSSEMSELDAMGQQKSIKINNKYSVPCKNKHAWDSNPNYRIWWKDSLVLTPCFTWVPNSPLIFILILGLCVHNTNQRGSCLHWSTWVLWKHSSV